MTTQTLPFGDSRGALLAQLMHSQALRRIQIDDHKLSRIIDACVTFGLMLDWAPEYFLGTNPQLFSLTKFVALPLIAIDFLRDPKSYTWEHQGWRGYAVLFGVLLGVGSGVAIGTVGIGRLVSLLPTIPIAMFFLKKRSFARVELVMKVAFLTSLVVPISLLLAYAGVLTPSQYATKADSTNGRGIRMLAGTSWSSLGLYGLFAGSAAGGSLLYARKKGVSVFVAVASVAVVAGTLVGLMATGQRTSPLACALSLVVAFGLFTSRLSIRGSWTLLLVAAFSVYIGSAFVPTISEGVGETFVARWSRALENRQRGDETDRETMLRVMLTDMATDPHLLPPGMDRVTQALGAGAHIVVLEAYYDGGVPMMAVVIAMLVGAANQAWKRVRSAPPDERPVAIVLYAFVIGAIVVTATGPALHIRIFWMMLALAISAPVRPVAKRRVINSSGRIVSNALGTVRHQVRRPSAVRRSA